MAADRSGQVERGRKQVILGKRFPGWVSSVGRLRVANANNGLLHIIDDVGMLGNTSNRLEM
jgi:hypothetical protein